MLLSSSIRAFSLVNLIISNNIPKKLALDYLLYVCNIFKFVGRIQPCGFIYKIGAMDKVSDNPRHFV
jgi:hypothetical protein